MHLDISRNFSQRETGASAARQPAVLRWRKYALLLPLLWLATPAYTQFQGLDLSPAEIEKLKNASPQEQMRMAKELSKRTQSGPAPTEKAESTDDDAVQPLGQAEAAAAKDEDGGDKKAADNVLSEEIAEYRRQVSLETDRLEPFGYRLFAGETRTFQPANEIPIPSEYRIGPGDVVRLQLFGQQNELYELPVSREGTIQLPKVGPVSVAGLSFDAMREQINKQVAKRFIGVEASVTLGELRSIRVFVMGEARNPGAYTVSSLSNITNALFISGGIKVSGSLRDVQLMRDGKVVTRVDLYDLLLHGDTSADRRLMPGDVIFIPPVGKTVAVGGQVVRPAIYELGSDPTIGRVVQLAGGYRSEAYPKHAKIQRIKDDFERTVEDIDLTRSANLKRKLKDGDELRVGSVNDLLGGYVTLQGEAQRDGNYEWREGLRFSDLINNLRKDLSENADLNYAMIVREINADRDITTLGFSPKNALENPGSGTDPQLYERDKILIFHNSEPRAEPMEPVIEQLRSQVSVGQPPPVVTIGGQVRFPGTYPLPKLGTIESLIEAAGGLLDSSYLGRAEVVRTLLAAEQAETLLLTTDIDRTGRSAEQIVLKPLDRVHVKQLPEYGDRLTVTLEGEVRFPGSYPARKGETLSALIERAGGLTKHAYPEGSVFTRQALREQEARRMREAEARLRKDIAALSVEESSQFKVAAEQDGDPGSKLQEALDEIQSATPVGRLVIDLPALLQDKPGTDVVLRDGDRLSVPQKLQSVTVIGEVQFPTSHLYQSRLSVDDYLERSGGGTRTADMGRVYVIRADGSVWLPRRSGWFSGSGGAIEPGDTVVVPLDIDQLDKLQIVSELSQILYQISLGAAAVNSF